jgi:hypothetical protein
MSESTTAVAEFKDPASGQQIQVIPKEGEPASEAITRVKKAHGANPELGDFQHLHDDYVAIGDALKSGDKQRAHSLLKKLSAAIDKPAPEPTEDELERARQDRVFETQKTAADTSRAYRSNAFSRPLLTKPEIPEPVNYDQFFSRG